MKRNFLIFSFFLFVSFYSNSQSKEGILLTVGEKEVTTKEFLRVYNKNLDLVKDNEQKGIDNYLKLFVEYQLKLNEAYRLKYNEKKTYKREFNKYKKQLTENYLSENKASEDLVKEAYNRSIQDVKAVHVLVRINEKNQDTVKAYQKILELKDILKKEGFDTTKKTYHNGKSVFVEDLGYFTAFNMVYRFESAAFNTKINEVSEPFRTRFGYHVVKVLDKRASKGSMDASHIMISHKQKDSSIIPKERIVEIYNLLQQGSEFKSLAKQFSDDKNSANKGGRLSVFRSGQLSSQIFEDTVFNLENDGDYSKPFKTDFGWHIVKRNKKIAVATYEASKKELYNKVQRDTRSRLIEDAIVEDLKKRYQIDVNQQGMAYFTTILNDDFFSKKWILPADFNKKDVLFSINKKEISNSLFGQYLMGRQGFYNNQKMSIKKLLDIEFKRFFKQSILKYREDNLEFENEEFASIISEYKEGLLLFDLMETEIWKKASEDTIALKSFYQKNASKYKSGKSIKATIISHSNNKDAKNTLKLLKRKKSVNEIKDLYNKDKTQKAIFTNGTFEISNSKFPSDLKIQTGVSKIYFHNDAYQLILIDEIFEEKLKSFEDSRGLVINDYQVELEKNWIKNLKERYPVEINTTELNKIKNNLD